jgi:hypothetical protein
MTMLKLCNLANKMFKLCVHAPCSCMYLSFIYILFHYLLLHFKYLLFIISPKSNIANVGIYYLYSYSVIL